MRALEGDARLLLLRLGPYPGARITTPIAAVLADTSAAAARGLLAELYRQGLLISADAGTYRMHDLIRAAAQRLSEAGDPEDERVAADDRLYRHIGQTLAHMNAVLYPTGPGPYAPRPVEQGEPVTAAAALAWLDENVADLLAIARRAIAQTWPETWWLSLGIEYYLRTHGFYSEGRELATAALSIAEAGGDVLGQAVARLQLGVVSFRLAHYDPARELLQRALADFERLENDNGQAEALFELAAVARLTGDLPAARTLLERSIAIDKGRTHGASGPGGLGRVLRMLGERETARRYLQEALTQASQGKDRYREAVVLLDLGGLEADAGRLDLAAGHLERALAMLEDLGERRGLADAHRELAALEMRRADLTGARHHLQAAMAIHATMHDPHHRANVLRDLGLLARAEGDHPVARVHLREALDIYRRLGLRADADVGGSHADR